jgi:S-adenosylmethionine hydrolase
MTSIRKFIGLITDFGLKGQHYVSAMKSVITSINPEIQIIDISHIIEAFSMWEASYIIQFALRDFPTESVIICVVDPEVGTDRKIIAAETKDKRIIIGPNNGIFTIPMLYNDSDFFLSFYSIENQNLFYHGRDGKQQISNTFHGRDIMAPIAAHLLTDTLLNDIGKKIPSSEIIIDTQLKHQHDEFQNIKKKSSSKQCELIGSIIFSDTFGNLITNIPENLFNKLQTANKITYLNQEDSFTEIQTAATFAEIKEKDIAIMKGSSGFLEISMNNRSAVQFLGLKVGKKILLWIE